MGKLFIKGLLLTLPIIFIIFILSTAFDYIEMLFRPIYAFLPETPVFGLTVKNLLTVVLFVIIVFFLGLFSGTKPGQWIFKKAEMYVPGFSLLKNFLSDDSNIGNKKIKSCLARIDEAWLFGFIIEEHDNGLITVFITGAPSPTSGTIYFLKEDQIRRLTVPSSEIVKKIMQLGYGSKDIIDSVDDL